jgi:predicted nucleotidyltransferase
MMNATQATKTLPALDEILTRLRTDLPDLRARYHIATIGVFGSYVRGEQRKTSDLDILVEFSVTPTLFQLAALQRELTDLSGIKVDLTLRRTLKPGFGKYILPEVIYL